MVIVLITTFPISVHATISRSNPATADALCRSRLNFDSTKRQMTRFLWLPKNRDYAIGDAFMLRAHANYTVRAVIGSFCLLLFSAERICCWSRHYTLSPQTHRQLHSDSCVYQLRGTHTHTHKDRPNLTLHSLAGIFGVLVLRSQRSLFCLLFTSSAPQRRRV